MNLGGIVRLLRGSSVVRGAQALAIAPRYDEIRDRGFGTLRFPREVEDEFRRSRATVARRRLAGAGFAGLIGVSAWMILDALTWREFQFLDAWLALGAWMGPLLIALIVLGLTPLRERAPAPWLIYLIDVGRGFALVWLSLVMDMRQMPGAVYPYVALLVFTSLLFISGVMTWRATLAGLTIALGYGIGHALLVHHHSVLSLDRALFFLVAVVLAGTAAGWRREHTARDQFLLSRMLSRAAEQDSLTGLLNHAAFTAHCERAWRQATREGKQIGLVIVDIDYFKPYNDGYGHQAGDRCIRQIAEVITKTTGRGFDAAGRLGGEEFAAFWYDLWAADLAKIAERIRAGVEALAIPHAYSSTSDRVTVSLGALSFEPQAGQDLQSAFKAADDALYAAKAGGRNRVVIAPSTTPP